jgi:hypothetical protein
MSRTSTLRTRLIALNRTELDDIAASFGYESTREYRTKADLADTLLRDTSLAALEEALPGSGGRAPAAADFPQVDTTADPAQLIGLRVKVHEAPFTGRMGEVIAIERKGLIARVRIDGEGQAVPIDGALIERLDN